MIGHETVGIETERRAIEASHRAVEERRPGQQRQRHRNLRHDQRALGAPATRMRELATVREGAGDINLTSRQRRPERTEPTRDERHRPGEEEDAAISQAHRVEPRHVARGKPDQAAFDGVRDDEGACQRDGRRDHALDQDLGGEPADRRTKGRPDGQRFPLPQSTRHVQARDGDAGDEQHQSGARQQRPQDRSRGSQQVVGNRRRHDRLRRLGPPRWSMVRITCCSSRVASGIETPGRTLPIAKNTLRKRSALSGPPKRRAPAPYERRRGHPGLCAAREIELGRHDANDDHRRCWRVGIEAHRDCASDDGPIGGKPADPQPVADDHGARSRSDFVGRHKTAADERRGADNLEERGRDRRHLHRLRARAIDEGKRPVHRADDRQTLEAPRPRAPVVHLAMGDLDHRQRPAIVAHPDHRKAILVGEAEGPQHHGVNNGVDGRDGADGRREQADGRRGHAACVAKRAEALLEQVADHGRARQAGGGRLPVYPGDGPPLARYGGQSPVPRCVYGATKSVSRGNAKVPAASSTTLTWQV